MLANEFAEYRTGKTLKTYSVNGSTWATLKEATHTRSGKQYACKIIRMEDMPGREHLVHNEVTALQRIQNASPNVLKMHRYAETAHDVRLYLDLCAGGSLSERIANSGAYSEVKAADFIRTLLRAVKHVHDSGVVHRDLRPENILFRTPDESAPIVITEFGLSRLVEEAPYEDHDNIQLYASGSWSYMAPEILANVGGHGAGVDVWQIGILTFFILTGGYTPFDRDTPERQRHAILTGEYKIPSNGKWESLSPNARQFIGTCLTIDPNRRPTVEEILSHAWQVVPPIPAREALQPKSRSSSVLDLHLPSSVRPPRFNPKRKWRIAGLTIQALNRMFSLTGQKPPAPQSQEQISEDAMEYSDNPESTQSEDRIVIVVPKNEDENECPSPSVSSLFDRKSLLTNSSVPTDEEESGKFSPRFSPRPISQEFAPFSELDESAAQAALDSEEVSKPSSASDTLYTPETWGSHDVAEAPSLMPDGGSDASPISTFVLFAPHELSDERAAVTPEDIRSLETDFTEGGTIVSVHIPTEAEAWVEEHYDDQELKSLRATGLRGPIAGMFSPEEPALMLFGSILDDQVLEIAKVLADVSGFVVMVRPAEDDPIPKLHDHPGEPPSPTSHVGEPKQFNTMDDGEMLKHPSLDVNFGPASRLRGGGGEESADYDSSVPWTSKAHKTVVWLRLWPDKHKYPVQVRVGTRTNFTVQSPGDSDGPSLEEPEVIGHVHLTIETQAKVLPDRSYTSIGFLVHQQDAIIEREFMDCGHDYPDQTLKTIIQKSSQKNAEVTAGYTSLQPTAEATLSYTKTRGRTVEYADNKPTPRCQIIHDPGERWNKDGKSYASYDITTVPGQNPTTGHHHPLKAEYAMGIDIHPNGENDRPRISFVTRNQVIVWISDSALKAKARGVLILMATYIPDIQTREALIVQKDLDIHFNETIAPPAANPPEATNAKATTALSLSAAPISGKSGKNSLLELFTDVRNKLNPPKEPTLANLFLREYISRGWNAGNQEWRGALWTSLDKDFRVTNLDHNAGNPVWKLGWNVNEQASSEYGGDDSDGAESHLPISTFVIFMPSGLSGTNDPTAINREDFNYLETHVQDGGNACSVYRSSDAEEWVEQNFDTSLLISIRSAGLGDPVATMVSPEMPGLAIFGSILDDATLQLAQNLADESTFAVMVRPVEDNPVMKLQEAAFMGLNLNEYEGVDSEDKMDHWQEGESANPENSDDEEAEEEEEEMPRTEGVFRLRGGAGRQERNLIQCDADPDYIVSAGVDRPDGFHRTKVRLHLQIQGDCLYDMAIFSRTAFKFQTAKSDIHPSLSEPMSRPQLLSCVDLKVETRPAEILLDRSYSNIGFVVHSPNFIVDREYLPRGFDPPLQTVTYGSQKSTQHGGSISGGMDGWSPTMLLKASSSRTTGETIQRADDKPAPSWHVKEQVGKEWNSADKSYSSYDIALSPTKLPHPLKIRFGMGIEFYGREERQISKLPAISHVLRNQIILWVADSTLKAKMRGMIVLTTTYIPDIKTSEPLTIVEEQTVDLRLKQSVSTTDTKSSSEDQVAANSVAIGVFEQQQKQKCGMQRFIKNFWATSTKHVRPSLPVEVPLYEYASRGWDATNEQWRTTIWPRLDADFADAGLSSSSARWNLTLNCSPAQGPPRDQEKPDEDAEMHTDVTGSAP